jgi:major vault protein
LNADTGEINIVIGPTRVNLRGNETIMNNKVFDALVVGEEQYIIIKNPYDKNVGKSLMGEREVIPGPVVLHLHPNEQFEEINSVHVLRRGQALRLQSLKDHEDKHAGQIWQIEGPCRYIPNKYTLVQKTVDAILINENEGIYVQNQESSEKKLVKGPCSYLLAANEEVFSKQYSDLERRALNLWGSPSEKATVIHLKKNECICILDNEKNERIVQGLRSVILGPEEFVKCLWLSAGKPKLPKQITAAKIYLGPDFMSDKFEVRTRDNAQLRLHLTYKWEFLVGEEDAWKIFSSDFIGYACSSLCSRIREASANYTFEEFHGSTVALIRSVLFSDNTIEVSGKKVQVHGLLFDEINLLISEVDVKEISPVNEEINGLLNESIKTNMRVVCQKMEMDAKREEQVKKIQAQSEIAKLRENLIDIQNENMDLDKVTKAKIDGQALLELAKAQKESEEVTRTKQMTVETAYMNEVIRLLSTENGAKLLELKRAQNFAKIKKTLYVSTDSKASIPL